MTRLLPPLPTAAAGFTRFAPHFTAQIPGFPTDFPKSPAPARKIELRPFGELLEPPTIRKKTPLPTLRQSAPESEPKNAPQADPSSADFTDADLAAALQPLIPVPAAPDIAGPGSAEFEASLRTSLRRALAEHSRSPFDQPAFSQRCLWHFDALLSSRSYEEVVQHKTHRFRVEEVYLYDQKNLSLISFASAKPSRHISPRKVQAFANRIALKVRDESGAVALDFAVDGDRHALVRCGKFSLLVALTRGLADPLAKSDLDYALRRIENLYADELQAGTPLLQELQALLEECLLIHSPIAPAEI